MFSDVGKARTKSRISIFGLKFYNRILQLQREASFTIEQLVSNKVDAITKKKAVLKFYINNIHKKIILRLSKDSL